jgi:hypothetical protein
VNATFQDIIGKTIQSVIISDYNRAGPITQVFLLFADGTSLELFGDFQAGRVEVSDKARIIAYAQKSQGKITEYP